MSLYLPAIDEIKQILKPIDPKRVANTWQS
jgi:hypothetical protein